MELQFLYYIRNKAVDTNMLFHILLDKVVKLSILSFARYLNVLAAYAAQQSLLLAIDMTSTIYKICSLPLLVCVADHRQHES